MDNLRLEHPGAFSTHSPAAAHHLLPFSPASIEFHPPLSRPNAQQSSAPFSAPWASLLAEPQYPQNPTTPSKQGLLCSDPAARSWDVSHVSPDAFMHQKQGHAMDIAAGFPQCASSTLQVLGGESPVLQLKHGNTLMASEFGHLAASMDAMRGDPTNLFSENAVNSFRKDGLHVPSLLAAVDKADASPLSAVSELPTASFACKADSFTGRDQRFVHFAWHEENGSERAFKDCPSVVKTEAMGENSMCLTESFRGCHYGHASGSDMKGIAVKKEQEAGVTIASLEDGSIGLRLGKRTYYGDVGGGAEEGSRRANSSSTCCNGSGARNCSSKNSSNVSSATTTTTANTAANTTAAATASAICSNTNTMTLMAGASVKNNSGCGISSKKQKGLPASAIVPMCQAEGCTADLSGAKDYHRRHKVCEWHSKASKAKVNNIDQRFCQQCSRFHVLSAFDEGKRSCRRRLAGHNERRRKPPPEPLPFLSPGGFAYFADARLHEHPYFLQHRRSSLVPSSIDNAVAACQLGLAGFAQQETMGNYHALELRRFMQGLPPGGGSGVSVLDGGGTLMLANGSALALSTVPSLPAPASSSSVGLLPHVSSDMAVSGRALSLLSPSLGSPETMSISLGMTTAPMDQILSETHALTASRQQVVPKSTACFSSGIGMSSALHGLPQSHNHALNSLTSSSSGCSTEIDQGEPPPMSNFEARSLFLMHSENSFQTMTDGGNSQQGRPVLDLMQISSEESHHNQQQAQSDLPYVDFTGLSIFRRQNIM